MQLSICTVCAHMREYVRDFTGHKVRHRVTMQPFNNGVYSFLCCIQHVWTCTAPLYGAHHIPLPSCLLGPLTNSDVYYNGAHIKCTILCMLTIVWPGMPGSLLNGLGVSNSIFCMCHINRFACDTLHLIYKHSLCYNTQFRFNDINAMFYVVYTLLIG